MLCRESGQAEIILWGLGIGATLTALSVVLGLVFGGLNYYEEDAVRSSAGWFDTSKYITGVLVCGGITLLYLGRRSKSWIFPLLAGICFVACLITYARAGAVALCAVLIWLPLWSVIFGRREQRQWLNRFLILAFAAGLLAPVFVKPDTLFVRWGDLQDSDKAGSGRATFWKVAVDGYVEATPAQQGLGYGYSAMSDMLFLNYGRISSIPTTTCSTCFWSAVLPERRGCCALIGALAWRVFRSSLFTVEGAAGAAILLTYLLHGQFIGQLWSTDAMTYYVLSLTCLHILGRPATAELRVRPHSDTEEYSRTLAPA